MIYIIHSYTVQAANVPPFIRAFEDGPWQRLPLYRSGNLHTGLLVGSTLIPVFLSLGIWESEQHYLAAQDTAEFRAFDRSVNLLVESHLAIGAFRYHCRQDRETIPTYSVQVSVFPPAQRACR